ncbi:ferredoxin [Streptomyces sp. NPDC002537]
MSITRVSIDSDLCIGAGQCVLTAPGVFAEDEDGFGTVAPGREDGGGDPRVHEAARACPSQAIIVEED